MAGLLTVKIETVLSALNLHILLIKELLDFNLWMRTESIVELRKAEFALNILKLLPLEILIGNRYLTLLSGTCDTQG